VKGKILFSSYEVKVAEECFSVTTYTSTVEFKAFETPLPSQIVKLFMRMQLKVRSRLSKQKH
jgi:hypothetical protein